MIHLPASVRIHHPAGSRRRVLTAPDHLVILFWSAAGTHLVYTRISTPIESDPTGWINRFYDERPAFRRLGVTGCPFRPGNGAEARLDTDIGGHLALANATITGNMAIQGAAGFWINRASISGNLAIQNVASGAIGNQTGKPP